MFSLIIVVISISLIAVLAVTTLFYGGTAFRVADEGAHAATIINQAQQIAGALEIYQVNNDGIRAATIADLEPVYLNSVPVTPSGTTYTLNVGRVEASGVTEGVCALIADKGSSLFNCANGDFYFIYR